MQHGAEDASSRSPRRTRSCRPARTSCSCRASSSTPKTRSRPSRRFYNGGVRELNTKIKVFPNNVFAKRLGFTEREFFEVADAAAIAEPPRVQF